MQIRVSHSIQMLPYYLSACDIQADAFLCNSLSVGVVSQMSYLLLSFSVRLVDSDLGSLPIYRLAIACNPHDPFLTYFVKIRRGIKGFLFENLAPN